MIISKHMLYCHFPGFKFPIINCSGLQIRNNKGKSRKGNVKSPLGDLGVQFND